MLINFLNKINIKNKFKIHKIKELNKEEIDFQIYLLRVIQLKRTIRKKSNNIVTMMILKILKTVILNHNLERMINKKKRKHKLISLMIINL